MNINRTRRRIAGGFLGPLVLLVVLPAPASAYPRPGITERVSVGAEEGTEANHNSTLSSVSADGRFVAFESVASNLVPADTNERKDIFVRDRVAGRTERVSVASDGTEADGDTSGFCPGSCSSSISDDGRHVAFTSSASNLVLGDTNGTWDVFVHDRERRITERVSVTSGGVQGNGLSVAFSISADGRFVGFSSLASNLVPGDSNFNPASPQDADVFVHDRETGTTERVSVASDGEQENGNSVGSSMSADGRFVGFDSLATNLVSGDTNGRTDVYVHDRETGITERVSVDSNGIQGNDHSSKPSVSADGRHVAFQTPASNLVPRDTNELLDVFVRDRETGITERVSVASDGAEGNSYSGSPSISDDGRTIVFDSRSENFVPGAGRLGDIFVHDRENGTTGWVSTAAGDLGSNLPSISADGRRVVFSSVFLTNFRGHVFLRDRGPAVGVGEVSAVAQGDQISVSGWATFSGKEIGSADDPGDDGSSIGTVPARDLGAELTGATIVSRPEEEDLFVRLGMASVPPPMAGIGTPTVLYGLRFDIGGARYEIRAVRAGASGSPPTAPSFGLYRCEEACLEIAPLSGGIGTTGPELLVSVPLSLLGASEGTEMRAIRAYTAIGERTLGALQPLDQIDLSDVTVPARTVMLGVAPAGTLEEDVAFDTEAVLTEGAFSGALAVSSLSPGENEAWVRACLGDACGPAAFGEVAR